ncbi:hypothetical protein K227x_61260 [Rubripirellula lacrimiformis]|uniref:Uncharacterized protein n=1 Tax=Rubripirellula lacrimiformis TaxID=1930273 RepID=A0A517NKM7_9BACT|nr:hypothetical protein [Rubripirellula lacrimiformis]QDT07698.1 hypothetical protein K227x_61260 [Rubripirellula lacrimiformis]
MSIVPPPPSRAQAPAADAAMGNRSAPLAGASNESLIETRISEAASALWWAEVTRRSLKLVLITIGCLLAWVMVDQWVYSPGPVARCVVGFGLWAAAITYVVRVIYPMLGNRILPEYAARSLERDIPDLRQSLVSYVTLRQASPASGLQGRVVRSIGASTAKRLASHDALPAEATGTMAWWIATAVGMLLLVIYAVVSPKNTLQSAVRVVAPLASIDAPRRVSITQVSPGDVEAIAGRSVDVSAMIRGMRDDEEPTVQWELASESRQASMQIDEASGSRQHVGTVALPYSAAGSVAYRIVAGDAVAGPFHLNVRDIPVVKLDSVRYQPPNYTAETPYTRTSGSITAIDGTAIQIHATVNRPVERAVIEFNPRPLGDVVRATAGVAEMEIDGSGTSITASFRMKGARGRSSAVELDSYRIRVWDDSDQTNPDPIIYPIRVLADLPPDVAIVMPVQSPKDVPINAQQMIEVHAADPDYGLQEIRLEVRSGLDLIDTPVLWRAGQDDANRAGQSGAANVRVQGNQVCEYRLRPGGQVRDGLGLRIGDTVQVIAVAIDNRVLDSDPTVEPNQTRTDPILLKIVAADELPVAGDPESGGMSRPDDQPAAGDGDQGNSNAESGNQGQPGSGGGGSGGGDAASQQQSGDGSSGSPSGGSSGSSEGESGDGSSGNMDANSGNPGGKGTPDPSSGDDAANRDPNSDPAPSDGAPGGESSADPSSTDSSAAATDAGSGQPAGDGRSPDSGSSDSGASGGGDSMDSPGGSNSPRGDGTDPSQSPSKNPGSTSDDGADENAGDSAADGGNGTEGAPGSEGTPAGQGGQGEPNQPQGSPNPAGENQSGGGESGDPESESGNPGQGKSDQGDDSNSKPSGPPQHDGEAFERIKDYLDKKAQDQQGSSGGQSAPNDSQSSQGQDASSKGSDGSDGSDASDSSGQPSAGQDPAGQNPAGQNPASQTQPSDDGGSPSGDGAGQPQGSDSPTGAGESDPSNTQQPAGQNGDPSSADDPTGGDQKGGDPKGGDPKGGDQAGSDQQGSSDGSDGDSGGEDGSASDGMNDSSAGNSSQGDSGSAGAAGAKSDPSGESSSTDSAKPDPDSPESASPGSKSSDSSTGGGKAKPIQQQSGDDSLPGTGDGSDGAGEGGDAALPPDPVNTEYAKQAADMVLDYLDQTRDQPDRELLDQLDWTESDLKRFRERWNRVRELDPGNDQGNQPGGREMEDALRSLGLRDTNRDAGRSERAGADSLRGLRDSGNRKPPPAAYRDAFDAFRRSMGSRP